LVFKIQHDREAGSLCYVRMYSGRIKSGDQVYNVGKKKKERVNRLFRMHANKSEPIDTVEAGDIAVMVGFKAAQTGDTVGTEGLSVLLEKMHFPEPVISVSIESATLSDRERLKEVLDILSREDPTFTSRDDSETGQLLISGMGELHLDVLVRRMIDDFKVDAAVGSPRVTYRESVTAAAEKSETYDKVMAGKSQTAGVTIRVEGAKRGSGSSYDCTARKAGIPSEILEAVENSVTACFSSGIRWGYPCIDIRATVTALDYNELTSTPAAFSACAAAAFSAACESASPELFEPVMLVDILTPAEFLGDAMNQITGRGGIITGTETKAATEVIHAEAPMAKMFGFSTSLRSVTKGRASFSMEFGHFAQAARPNPA
jgi:elongation factor G